MLSLLRSHPRAIFGKGLWRSPNGAMRGVSHLPPLQSSPAEITEVHKDILKANAAHAAPFVGKHVITGNPRPPALHAAFLTCMDARLDPHDFLGIRRGDAHVIRNAGARASEDAIRSLVISHKLLGTTEWFVIHHTDCGLEMVKTDEMGQLLAGSLATAKYNHAEKRFENTSSDSGSYAGKFINWLTISDQHQSIKEDVHRIVTHPLVNAKEVVVHGYLYHVTSGKMEYVCSGGQGTNTASRHASGAALASSGPDVDAAVAAARSTFYVPPTPREHQLQSAQDQAKVAVFEEANRLARAAKEREQAAAATSCGTKGCGCGDKNTSSAEKKRAQQQLA